MRKLTLLVTSVFLFLTGCVQTEILDDLNIETAKGYDTAGEKSIIGTALYLRYLSDKQIENVTLTAQAQSTREVINLLEKRSEQPLVRGSLETVIISDKMAKKGMLHIADSLQRDASVGARVLLLVSSGEAGEILDGDYGIKGNSAYITNLIEHNMERGDLAVTNLHKFLFTYYQEGHTPYLPIIRKLNEKTLDLSGIALFKKDKMVYSLPKEEMFYFKLLADKYSEGNQVVSLTSEEEALEKSIEASVDSLQSKHKIDIEHFSDPLSINIKIDLKGIIKEYTGKTLSPQKIDQIEKTMERQIVKHCTEMLKTFQELGIDPVGLGQLQKHGVRGFDFKRWEAEQYPNAVIHVKADVQILEAGTVE